MPVLRAGPGSATCTTEVAFFHTLLLLLLLLPRMAVVITLDDFDGITKRLKTGTARVFSIRPGADCVGPLVEQFVFCVFGLFQLRRHCSIPHGVENSRLEKADARSRNQDLPGTRRADEGFW